MYETNDRADNAYVDTKRRLPPQVFDLNALIETKIKKFKDNSFVYLTYTVSKENEYFTPYSLAEVPFSRVDPTNYYTMSKYGVTYFSRAENHFTKLNIWQTEYNLYQKLIQVLIIHKLFFFSNFNTSFNLIPDQNLL